MKKIFFLSISIGLLFVIGCSPEKPGGGGHPQPYNSSDGTYK